MDSTRRIGASVLAAVTAVLLLVASLGWWADRHLLDSDRFTETAGSLLTEQDVQDALAEAITDQISSAAGTDLDLVQPFIATIVRGVVESTQFQTIFDAAVRRAHQAVVDDRLRGAVLDLTEVVDRVREAIQPIAPDIARQIPSGEEIRIQVLRRSQVDAFYRTLELFRTLLVVVTVLMVACFVGALACSTRRWRTVALTAWIVVGLFAQWLVAQRIGRSVVAGLPDAPEYSAAAGTSYGVILHDLAVQSVVVLVVGAAVALAAGWIDRTGGWAAVTEAARRARAWLRAQAAGRPPGTPVPPAASTTATTSTGPTDEATGPVEVARGLVQGALAPRLPAPGRTGRSARWWRAAGLLVVGLFAVLSPGSLTTVLVVLLGVAAIYLALTEALAAWATPRGAGDPGDPGDPGGPDAAPAEATTARGAAAAGES
jgi:hypothetical protein